VENKTLLGQSELNLQNFSQSGTDIAHDD